jgi:hypothetical protein
LRAEFVRGAFARFKAAVMIESADFALIKSRALGENA